MQSPGSVNVPSTLRGDELASPWEHFTLSQMRKKEPESLYIDRNLYWVLHLPKLHELLLPTCGCLCVCKYFTDCHF